MLISVRSSLNAGNGMKAAGLVDIATERKWKDYKYNK